MATLGLNRMPGLNSELERDGDHYHIQTQDKGLGANYVESIIYKSGRVLSSRRAYYTSFLNSDALQDKIDIIIKEEHNSSLEEISKGKFDHL